MLWKNNGKQKRSSIGQSILLVLQQRYGNNAYPRFSLAVPFWDFVTGQNEPK